jgi:hypothetical protein
MLLTLNVFVRVVTSVVPILAHDHSRDRNDELRNAQAKGQAWHHQECNHPKEKMFTVEIVLFKDKKRLVNSVSNYFNWIIDISWLSQSANKAIYLEPGLNMQNQDISSVIDISLFSFTWYSNIWFRIQRLKNK